MRNIVLAHEVSGGCRKDTAVVIAYADHPRLHFPRALHSSDWASFVSMLRDDHVRLHVKSYQELLRIAIASKPPNAPMMAELASFGRCSEVR